MKKAMRGKIMRIKKLVSLFMAVVMLSVCASFPTFSADTHEKLTHLTGDSLVDTDVVHKSFSNPDRLFDGDSSASHANIQGATDPDGNGVFGYMWLEAGDTNYITIDLGGIYDLSQINIYWGWAPQAKPIWNSWEYAVPASYTIYVANTMQGLESATPVKTVSGLYKNSMGIADVSTANFSATGRYVKIVHTFGSGGCFALRELEFFGAEKLPITTLGASIRLEDDEVPTGLRFGASVDKTALSINDEWKYVEDSDIEFGFFLLPEEKLGNHETLTEYLFESEGESLKIPARRILTQDSDTIVYTAVLTKIPESNFETSIVAVPYLRTADTVTYFKETTKSYMDVAVAAKSSYEKGNPNNITKEQYDVLLEITKDYVAPLTYYDIDAAAQAKGLNYNNATLPASLFVETEGSYLGYKIDGTYKVDEDTLRMLTTVDCIGNGTLKYKDYNSFTDYIAESYYGEGYGPHCYAEQITSAPVSKLSDPVYMSMVLPSEGKTYMDVLYPSDPRNNGNNMHAVCTVSGCTRCNKVEYVRLNALGAFYLNQNKKNELENYKDVQFKLCLGNIRLFVNTASGGWKQVKTDATPTSGNGSLYCLPWSLEWNSATSQTYLDSCKSLTNVTRKTSYSEITLKVSDFFFSKTFQGTDSNWYTIDERVLHFWGGQYNIANDDEILGIVASYDMWIEYDESIGIKLEDYFISSIGADWRYSNGNGGYITRQAFAGYKHAVSTEKITVFGHNLTPTNYDSLMPSTAIDYFKNTLGIK